MAYNELNNAESGLIIRQKINAMFTEIYHLLFGGDESSGAIPLNLWTIIEGVLTPIDDDVDVGVGVLNVANRINVADKFIVDSAGNITIPSLAPFINALKSIQIDSGGVVSSNWLDWSPYTILTADHTATLENHIFFVKVSSAAITITLPAISTCDGKSYLIKKTTGVDSVILVAHETDIIGSGTSTATTLAIPSVGEWVKIRATTKLGVTTWEVEAQGGSSTSSGGGSAFGGHIKINSSTTNLDITYPYVSVDTDANCYLSLPQIASVGSVMFTIRKELTNGYSLSINRTGSDRIIFNSVEKNEIFTVTPGGFIQLVSDVSSGRWYVMMNGGTWI